MWTEEGYWWHREDSGSIVGKMGKSESSGGASTYIYGIIFLLYAGIAVVLFIYMMNKRYFTCFNHINSKSAAGGGLELHLKRRIYGNLSKTNQSSINCS